MSEPTFTLRAARMEDLAVIVDLCAEHAAYEGATYTPSGKAERLARHLFGETPAAVCLIVEQAGAVVGYATYCMEFSTWDAAHYMHMDCLYLRPEARGLGIGKQIMQHLIDEAQKRGCVNVQWQTPVSNTRAIAFYERLPATGRHKMRFTLNL